MHPEIALLGTSIELIDEKGSSLEVIHAINDPGLIEWSLLFGNCIAHSSVMFRKSVIDKVGPYSSNYFYAQDYELWSRINQEFLIDNIPELLVHHRIGNNRISSKYSFEQAKSAIKVMKQSIISVVGKDIPFHTVENLYMTVQDLPLLKQTDVHDVCKLIRDLYLTYKANDELTEIQKKKISHDAVNKLYRLASLNIHGSFLASIYVVSRAELIEFRLPSFQKIKQIFANESKF